MAAAGGARPCISLSSPELEYEVSSLKLGFRNLSVRDVTRLSLGRLRFRSPVKAMEGFKMSSYTNERPGQFENISHSKLDSNMESMNDCADQNGKNPRKITTIGKSTNILWHKCSIERVDRQELLKQKGCVIWVTGLSGSGKSTVASALARVLHSKGKLSYILDGDNVRHGLNQDLSFEAEDRVENIRRVGEVAKLFADAGIICIACLISPYRVDRDACRSLLQEGDFIEVFMDVPLKVCEARDPKGLYKLARAGKIKGFTGIDDPYEPPLKCEIKLQQRGETCVSPCEMAETVMSYLDENGYLQA